ncbi:MAG TPA: serine hydrolase domain-containing protein [Opitutaceae bacterium]|nr:serine hydrolase domain-containing protein [Opitutaceae bacterium]
MKSFPTNLSRILALSVLISGSACFLRAVEAGGSTTIARLDGRTLPVADLDLQVARLMKAARVTGLGVAVVNEGRIVHLKAHGIADRKTGAALTDQSVMSGASFSKAAFAILVMQLVEEGRLDLDQPIERYLGRPLGEFPQYRDLRSDERSRRFTLRMLLNHTTGLPNWRWIMPGKKLTLHFEPGSRYAYSGEGIAIAQLVVETVTAKSITALMQDRIFGPLKMSRTGMIWSPAFSSDLAIGHDEQEKPLERRQWKTPGAAGSMDTCLADYAKLIEALLQGRLLKPASVEEMTKPGIEIFSKRQFPTLATETTDENRAVGLAYGLGWGVLQRTPHGPAFFKEGHDDGWEHFSLCHLQKRSAVILMTNSSNGESIFKELLELVTGDSSLPWRWENYVPYNSTEK